eukprot:COSAG03_NODE_10680_length_636_cov_0.769088_1_plen_160_part_00
MYLPVVVASNFIRECRGTREAHGEAPGRRAESQKGANGSEWLAPPGIPSSSKLMAHAACTGPGWVMWAARRRPFGFRISRHAMASGQHVSRITHAQQALATRLGRSVGATCRGPRVPYPGPYDPVLPVTQPLLFMSSANRWLILASHIYQSTLSGCFDW